MIIVACPCSQPGNFIQRTHLRQNSQNRNTPEPCYLHIPEGRRDHTTPAETLRLHGLD
jgi:hypothetical protein